MGEIDLEKAKEMFRSNGTSRFNLERAGVYEEYAKFEISRNTERIWREELQAEALARYRQTDNLAEKADAFDLYGRLVRQLREWDGLFWMVKEVEDGAWRLDTTTLVRYIQAICDILPAILEKRLRTSIIKRLRRVLIRVSTQPISISKDYMVNGEFPENLAAERVLEDLMDALRYCKPKVVRKEFFTYYRQMGDFALKAEYFAWYANFVKRTCDQTGFRRLVREVEWESKDLDSHTLVQNIHGVCYMLPVFQNARLWKRTVKRMRRLLLQVWEQPIWISEDYMENGAFPEDLTVVSVEEHIKQTIQFCDKIASWNFRFSDEWET